MLEGITTLYQLWRGLHNYPLFGYYTKIGFKDPKSTLMMLARNASLSVHRSLCTTTVCSNNKYLLGWDGGWLNVGRGAVILSVGFGAISASFVSGGFLLLYPALEETAALRL